jgi:hypothetical protein
MWVRTREGAGRGRKECRPRSTLVVYRCRTVKRKFFILDLTVAPIGPGGTTCNLRLPSQYRIWKPRRSPLAKLDKTPIKVGLLASGFSLGGKKLKYTKCKAKVFLPSFYFENINLITRDVQSATYLYMWG